MSALVLPAPAPLVMSPLRISTTVTTCHSGSGINLKKLFDNFHLFAIPFGYPGEGFLKMEYETKVVGSSTRDVLTKRKVTEKTFFNQATLVIRKTLAGRGWKEVNVKLFANGGVQMTGVPTPEFSQESIKYVISQIKAKMPEIFVSPDAAGMTKFKIQLINSDYSINRQIYQEKLHKVLSNVYNLFSSHESTIYQGVNTKYYYNEAAPATRGICMCERFCNGQAHGTKLGACKKITIAAFQTGSIIITGARNKPQLDEAYTFMNEVLQVHRQAVVKPL
jgi:TATA-box binding protein (TBP) (component of TFIID and TFIIIB)